jgi:hypothetical protein
MLNYILFLDLNSDVCITAFNEGSLSYYQIYPSFIRHVSP